MNITVTENVSAVTFNNVPLYKTIMEDTLTAVAEAGINIDMISMTAPTSERFGFGFTLDDDTAYRFTQNNCSTRNNTLCKQR